jgi:hypothetical protein
MRTILAPFTVCPMRCASANGMSWSSSPNTIIVGQEIRASVGTESGRRAMPRCAAATPSAVPLRMSSFTVANTRSCETRCWKKTSAKSPPRESAAAMSACDTPKRSK